MQELIVIGQLNDERDGRRVIGAVLLDGPEGLVGDDRGYGCLRGEERGAPGVGDEFRQPGLMCPLQGVPLFLLAVDAFDGGVVLGVDGPDGIGQALGGGEGGFTEDEQALVASFELGGVALLARGGRRLVVSLNGREGLAGDAPAPSARALVPSSALP